MSEPRSPKLEEPDGVSGQSYHPPRAMTDHLAGGEAARG